MYYIPLVHHSRCQLSTGCEGADWSSCTGPAHYHLNRRVVGLVSCYDYPWVTPFPLLPQTTGTSQGMNDLNFILLFQNFGNAELTNYMELLDKVIRM